MQFVTDLQLPLLALEDPELAANPMPAVEWARQQHPWLARSSLGGYIVHGYDAVREILYMDEHLRPNFEGIVELYGADKDWPWSRFMQEMMLAAHGETHQRLRSSVAAAFTPRVANRYRGLMSEVISNLLEEWIPKGSFDFTEFASHFPITVFCGLMGTGTERIAELRNAFEIQTASHSLDPNLLPQLLTGFKLLWDFVDQLVIKHEAYGEANGGLLEDLIVARDAGIINDTELRHMLILLFVGGYDTSRNMLSLTIFLLLQNPQYWTRCAEERSFCTAAVEETLRHSGVSSVYRRVSAEFVYGDVIFPQGSNLTFMLGLAGRDPSAFDAPLEFRPGRNSPNRQVAFGRGRHICVGQHLARLLLEEGLHLIAQRMSNPRISGEVTWRPYLGIWGIKNLPIEFDAYSTCEVQP